MTRSAGSSSAHTTAAPLDPLSSTDQTTVTTTTTTTTSPPKKRRRVILFNGWLRQYSYPRLWMKPLAEDLLRIRYCSRDGGDDETSVEVEVVGNTKPAQTADAEKYIKHLADLVGPGGPDENTFFIGQSIGCQVILRYLARLPPGSKVGGCLCVGCWLTLDHTTRKRRSSAIDELIQDEWDTFEKGWMDYHNIDFANVRLVCPAGKLICLMSDNDPYRGLDDDGQSNKQDFEEIVGARVIFRHGKGHFNSSRLDEEDTRLVETELLGLIRQEALPVETAVIKRSSDRTTNMAHNKISQRRREFLVTTKARSKL